MSASTRIVPIICFGLAVLCAPRSAMAQADCSSFVVDDANRPADDAAFARTLGEAATNAQLAGCLSQADRLLEGAYRLDPKPAYAYARILVREHLQDYAYALELLEAYRAELLSDPSVGDIVEVEARLRARLRATPIEPPTEPAPRERSTLDTVGPVVLAGLGAVSLGMAVYGFTANCRDTASNGTCLRGSEPRIGLTLGYSAFGVVALTAGAVWWILAIPKQPVDARVGLGVGGLVVSF